MVRQTVPLLLFSLLLVTVTACVPALFSPTTVGNINGFRFPGPFGFFVPFGGTGINNPFVPVTVNTNRAGTTGGNRNLNIGGTTTNLNTPTQAPGFFNQNGTFNLNFNNTFNRNFTGVFNLNNSIVNQNSTP